MPEAWEEKEDEAGIYYHDVVNNITTRVHPLDDIFKLVRPRSALPASGAVRRG